MKNRVQIIEKPAYFLASFRMMPSVNALYDLYLFIIFTTYQTVPNDSCALQAFQS